MTFEALLRRLRTLPIRQVRAGLSRRRPSPHVGLIQIGLLSWCRPAEIARFGVDTQAATATCEGMVLPAPCLLYP
jgi:hypothetical protein